MNPEQILFFLFGAVSLIGAIAVISFRLRFIARSRLS